MPIGQDALGGACENMAGALSIEAIMGHFEGHNKKHYGQPLSKQICFMPGVRACMAIKWPNIALMQ
jgi:hypothetical protein